MLEWNVLKERKGLKRGAMNKECNCNPERRVNGTHYSWCESNKAPEVKVSKEPEICNCNPDKRVNGTHYSWCNSFQIASTDSI